MHEAQADLLMTREQYAKKRLDPRWQKARMKVLERDEWTCLSCLSTEETLHVHHRYYISRRDPWDYPDWALVTLCKKCHDNQYDPSANEDGDPKMPSTHGWEGIIDSMAGTPPVLRFLSELADVGMAAYVRVEDKEKIRAVLERCLTSLKKLK
jgi:hypothetical protein